MSDKLIIFDTTLRDGEQSPGASMTKDEKVRIAKSLERMRMKEDTDRETVSATEEVYNA